MRYISCSNIQNGLRFEYNCIKLCCFMGSNTPEPLYLKKDYYGEKLNWNELIDTINVIRENQKNGITDPHCKGCFGLQEQDWDDNKKFKWIQIAHWSECNCNCTYCYRLQSDFVKPKKRYKIMPIIKELDKLDMIDYNGELAYSGGEPASLREFDEITNFFIKKGEKLIMVHTNGIKPVKSVLKGLKTDTMSVTVSVDCGDREKFKQIKQVDAYNKVIDTLKKYVKAQGSNRKMVRSKYIIIPNVNDTKEDINKWLDETERIGIQQVILDFEADWLERNKRNIPEHIDEIYQYIVDSSYKRGLDLQFYGVATQYREIKGLNVDGYGLHQE
ncbi:TPA: radical SAM protein [Candidatus Avigastranaerophilus faecigallinarum]|nr:radical SAM protein [Candidatus Avigastranaerophilus faecigallinarum]